MKGYRRLGLCALMGLLFLAGYGFRSALAQKSSAELGLNSLPPDVDHQSLARLPWPTRDQFATEEEKQIFDRMAKSGNQFKEPRQPTLGPTPMRMHSPVVAEGYNNALRWIRDQGGLEPRYIELSILISARESNSAYQWLQHDEQSAKVLPRESLEVVRNRRDTKGLDPKDAILIQFGREMYQQPKVSSKTYAEMERLFGKKATMTAVLLMAHYTANELMLRAYDQHLPPGEKYPFPKP